MEFTLKLTEQEAQTVLNALVERPFKEVADVINTIQEQAIKQRQAAVSDEQAAAVYREGIA